jgi:ribosomal protein S15P/S13E
MNLDIKSNCGLPVNQLFFVTERLRKLNQLLKQFPNDFKIKNKLAKLIKQRRQLQEIVKK